MLNSPTLKTNLNSIANKKMGKGAVKSSVPAVNKSVDSVCYYLTSDEWQSKTLSSRKARHCIGSSSADSEIVISDHGAEKVQVIIQELGNSLFVMEYGREALLYINGIPDYQSVLSGNGYCAFSTGDSKMVLVRGDGEGVRSGQVDSLNKFTLVCGEKRSVFSSKQACLIGSHSICDFIVNESMFKDNQESILQEPFLALMNSYNNQLFIEPLSKKFPLMMQGNIITDTTPICANSTFTIGSLTFSIPESTTTPIAGDFMDFSSVKKKKFILLQVLDKGAKEAVNLELPRAGKAVTIGRGSDVTYSIPEPSLSKQHLQLIIYEKSVLAADLNSTNGTYVNDEKVRKKLMHAGDFLGIGECLFFLSYNES